MRDLLKRLDKLEDAKQCDAGQVFLLRWTGNAVNYASCQGERMERAEGESQRSFTERAAQHFRPASGSRAVWLG